VIRSKAELDKMRKAGKVVAEMHDACARAAVPGATTADLDRAAGEIVSVLRDRGARVRELVAYRTAVPTDAVAPEVAVLPCQPHTHVTVCARCLYSAMTCLRPAPGILS